MVSMKSYPWYNMKDFKDNKMVVFRRGRGGDIAQSVKE